MAIVIFFLSYIGIALGRIPGLALDRVGIALLGAIAMVVTGVVPPDEAVRCIDFPTICLLYALMIISAQLRLGGFYTFVAAKISGIVERPGLFLFLSMVAAAFLSALLANDIICFAMTPILAFSILRAKMNPVPFLIGLAVASNIGSAATLIGNPQNMLIGQVGRLSFASFFYWAVIPSVVALIAGYGLILLLYRKNMVKNYNTDHPDGHPEWPSFNIWQTSKGIAAIIVLVILFLTKIPRDVTAIGTAAVLLCSRKMKTREILGLVDWQLITLFCSLFIIIHGISRGNLLSEAVKTFEGVGLSFGNLPILTGVSTILSNIFSNVPAAMLLMRFLDHAKPVEWYVLAVSSTFAGNLFLLGSIANLIVVEKAADHGIKIGFKEHAAVGIPVTLVSLLILVFWAVRVSG